ncbi:MAG: aminoglycoside phosphotransferase family protein [Vicinamibacterales bacterium]
MPRPRPAEFAWPRGDRPGRLAFTHALAAPVEAAIRQALGDRFAPARDAAARFAALADGPGPAGRYELAGPGGRWFVRVSARRGNASLERAIVEALAEGGVPVSPPTVAGVPLAWAGETYRIDVRPFIDGRHFAGALADVLAVAAVLGRAHAVLAGYERRQEVRDAAARRNAVLAGRLDRVRGWLADGAFGAFHDDPAWAASHRDWLERMTRDFEPRVDLAPGAQCLHGELHQGNVLFRAPDGAPVLLDFEEAVHVFAPPAWDVAFLVQRFILAGNPPLDEAREAVARVREAYAAALPPLAPAMRQGAWFAMTLLLEQRAAEGLTVPPAEYDKFVALERQASTYHDVL